jgi:hypothetical protein
MLATAWRRRVTWYPGDWIWPVLAALVIAALAGGIAILVTNDNDGTKTKAAVNETIPTNTSTNPTGTETGPTTSVPTTTVPTTTVPTEPPPPPPPPAAGGGLTEWPQGQDGWTVVLVSTPQTAGRPAAVREARRAIAAGLTDVGVLDSSDFSSLHSGYWVIFSGVFNSRQEAESALDTATGTYSAAYVRQIVQ